MPRKSVHDLGEVELGVKERELREEIFRLRFRKATGQVEDRTQVRKARRELARVLTVQRERQPAANDAGAARSGSRSL